MLDVQLKDIEESHLILEPSNNALKSKAWSIKTSRKIKHFIWQALTGYLPILDRLVDRHCGTDHACPRCNGEKETINHLLFECPAATQV